LVPILITLNDRNASILYTKPRACCIKLNKIDQTVSSKTYPRGCRLQQCTNHV